MSYSKNEAESLLEERMKQANDVVNGLSDKIHELEKEKILAKTRRDEAAYALGIIKQMRGSNMRAAEPEERSH